MATYIIGFVVCLCAIYESLIKEHRDKNPGDDHIPAANWLMIVLLSLAVSCGWPIVLAEWMRSVKKK